MSALPAGITIRPATRADIPDVERLIDASIRVLGGRHYTPAEVESSLRHLFGVDTRMIDDGTYLVALDGPRLVGAGGWSRRRTPYGGDRAGAVRDAGLRDPATDPGVLRAFYVHPVAARRGVGTALMARAEADAAAAGFARFELVSTLSGLAFYERLGYARVDDVSIPLPDGEVIRAVRMRKG